jgi:hypothetical protein
LVGSALVNFTSLLVRPSQASPIDFQDATPRYPHLAGANAAVGHTEGRDQPDSTHIPQPQLCTLDFDDGEWVLSPGQCAPRVRGLIPHDRRQSTYIDVCSLLLLPQFSGTWLKSRAFEAEPGGVRAFPHQVGPCSIFANPLQQRQPYTSVRAVQVERVLACLIHGLAQPCSRIGPASQVPCWCYQRSARRQCPYFSCVIFRSSCQAQTTR